MGWLMRQWITLIEGAFAHDRRPYSENSADAELDASVEIFQDFDGNQIRGIYVSWIEAKRKGGGLAAMQRLLQKAERARLPVRADIDSLQYHDEALRKMQAYWAKLGFRADPAGTEAILWMPSRSEPREILNRSDSEDG